MPHRLTAAHRQVDADDQIPHIFILFIDRMLTVLLADSAGHIRGAVKATELVHGLLQPVLDFLEIPHVDFAGKYVATDFVLSFGQALVGDVTDAYLRAPRR